MTEEQLESLIRKYADGTATDEEIQHLMHWYRTYPISDINWPATEKDEKEQLKARMLGRLQSALAQQPARIVRFSWMKVAAAMLVLITGIALTYYFMQPGKQSFVTVTNPSGKIQMVTLPDSSQVWLNASSTLSYNKSFSKNREIKLDGEAFFQVSHDPSHPFSVEAGGVKTIVLGTSFNISAYAKDLNTKIAVITGKVKVEHDKQQLAILAPAQQFAYNKASRSSNISITDTSNVLAWKKGELRFPGQSLADIAVTLERWYDIKIHFQNPGMASCRYYMSFKNTVSLDSLLSSMAQLTDMQYKTDDQTRTIHLSGTECR